MTTPEQKVMMSIYLSSTDMFHGSLMYQAITVEAKNFGIAGATVFKGLLGYGVSSKNIAARFSEVSTKDPVVIQMIEDRSKLERFLIHVSPWLEEVQKGHIITFSPIEIVMVKQGSNLQ
jgi:hypothetical protein